MSHGLLTTLLAKRFLERHAALQLGNGKKADDAALHFFCGAACAFEESGQVEAAQHVGRVGVMIVSVRGMLGVRELAAREV